MTLDEAVARVQAMRDEAERKRADWDRPGEGLDEQGCWKDWDAQCYGERLEGAVETLDSVLEVLGAPRPRVGLVRFGREEAAAGL